MIVVRNVARLITRRIGGGSRNSQLEPASMSLKTGVGTRKGSRKKRGGRFMAQVTRLFPRSAATVSAAD